MKKVRIAVIGAGWISQEAFMPSVKQTGNAEIAAIVSGDAEKAKKLAAFHNVPAVYDYSQFDEMAKSKTVDAVYIATPNSSHAEYAIRAAEAGLHVLVEKPMATTVAECEAMIAAAKKSGVILITAYRLHNDPATIAAAEIIRSGEIGEPRFFSSNFSFQSALGNHRLLGKHWGGPLQDIGVYCLNAVRHMFGENPHSVLAATTHGVNDPRFTEVIESAAVSFNFSNGKMAQFYSGFGADNADWFEVLCTKGSLRLDFAYRFEKARRLYVRKGDETEVRDFPATDNFSGMTAYFADCIQKGIQPIVSSQDGLEDVKIMRAIERAAETGTLQKIECPEKMSLIDGKMRRAFPPSTRKLLL